MRTIFVCVALLCALALPPTGHAWRETDGCKIGGASTSLAGATCPPVDLWDSVTLSVMAVCRNSCTGERWEAHAGPVSVTSNSGCGSCPLKLKCQGCVARDSDQKVHYFTSFDKQQPNSSGGCKTQSFHEARATCDCPGCGDPTPILISLVDGDYELTDMAHGVLFDLNGDGVAEQTAWTAAGSDEGFLVLDRNLNGVIDDFMEVFGDHTPQLPSDEPNGWRALAVWDDSLNGGNEDGVIDAGDAIFSALQVWVDANHNGFSEPDELSSLEDEGLEYLSLDYGSKGWVDDFGNGFKFPSEVGRRDGRVIVAWDVFFAQ